MDNHGAGRILKQTTLAAFAIPRPKQTPPANGVVGDAEEKLLRDGGAVANREVNQKVQKAVTKGQTGKQSLLGGACVQLEGRANLQNGERRTAVQSPKTKAGTTVKDEGLSSRRASQEDSKVPSSLQSLLSDPLVKEAASAMFLAAADTAKATADVLSRSVQKDGLGSKTKGLKTEVKQSKKRPQKEEPKVAKKSRKNKSQSPEQVVPQKKDAEGRKEPGVNGQADLAPLANGQGVTASPATATAALLAAASAGERQAEEISFGAEGGEENLKARDGGLDEHQLSAHSEETDAMLEGRIEELPESSTDAGFRSAQDIFEGDVGTPQEMQSVGQALSPVRKSGRARRLSMKATELICSSPEEAKGLLGLQEEGLPKKKAVRFKLEPHEELDRPAPVQQAQQVQGSGGVADTEVQIRKGTAPSPEKTGSKRKPKKSGLKGSRQKQAPPCGDEEAQRAVRKQPKEVLQKRGQDGKNARERRSGKVEAELNRHKLHQSPEERHVKALQAVINGSKPGVPDVREQAVPVGPAPRMAFLAELLEAERARETPSLAAGTLETNRAAAKPETGSETKTCTNCGRASPNRPGHFFYHPFTREPCCASCFHAHTAAKKKAIQEARDPEEAIMAAFLRKKLERSSGTDVKPLAPNSRAERDSRDRPQAAGYLAKSPNVSTEAPFWGERVKALTSSPVFKKARSPRKAMKPGLSPKLAWNLSLGESDEEESRKSPQRKGVLGKSPALKKPVKSGSTKIRQKGVENTEKKGSGSLKRKQGSEIRSPDAKKRKKEPEVECITVSPKKSVQKTISGKPPLNPFQKKGAKATSGAPVNKVGASNTPFVDVKPTDAGPPSPSKTLGLKAEPSKCAPAPSRDLIGALGVAQERKKAEGVFYEMDLRDIHPKALLGRQCKVFWPMDEAFYLGVIFQYSNQSGKHKIVYKDGYEEIILLAEQRIQLQVFPGRDPLLDSRQSAAAGASKKETAAASSKKRKRDEVPFGQPCEGDVIWGKVKGHAAWPCLVMTEEQAERVGLAPGPKESAATSLPVQFFGTYEVGRLRADQMESLESGLGKGLHKKLKSAGFLEAQDETEAYLRHQALPKGMQAIFGSDDDVSSSDDEQPDKRKSFPSPPPHTDSPSGTPKPEATKPLGNSVEGAPKLPIYCAASLTVHALGVIPRSKNFHTSAHIFPVGFRATRMFFSLKDPSKRVAYVMDILEGQQEGVSLPLFRVITEDEAPIENFNSRELWIDITSRIGDARKRLGQEGGVPFFKSGPSMLGVSDPKVVPFIESLPHVKERCPRYAAWHTDLPAAQSAADTPPPSSAKSAPLKAKAASEPAVDLYKPVEVNWRHADRCNVCYTVEDYDDNQLIQCDKCRVMVHMHCYGEMEPPDGYLWLCQLCQEDAPRVAPRCCLCPVIGGAMKRTTDGRWAHVTCAVWVPETMLTEQNQIDNVDAIPKDRWNLCCSLCRVRYGACIQCEEKSCKTAFHPLCARARGLFMEVVTSDDMPATSYQRNRQQGTKEKLPDRRNGKRKVGEAFPSEIGKEKARREGVLLGGELKQEDENASDEESEEALRLLAWCSKHRKRVNCEVGKVTVRESESAAGPNKLRAEEYVPPVNASGCARTEPFDPAARRGQRAPEAVATALAKRLFVRQVAYEITGRRWDDRRFSSAVISKPSQALDRRKDAPSGPRAGLAAAGDALEKDEGLLGNGPKSATERYIMMRTSQRQRLAFGKSAIHGWGVFAKQRHAKSSFVTEYAGDVVRQAVADAREKNLYNSIVGAGTYMFRIDDQRVVDATKAGSIAHLINHSCEPNCFSRVVKADGDEHIVIVAKRDIQPGEEFTYDYRFNSKDEILTCNCGAQRCRGTVNFYDDDEGNERGQIMAPVSEIRPWDFTKMMRGSL